MRPKLMKTNRAYCLLFLFSGLLLLPTWATALERDEFPRNIGMKKGHHGEISSEVLSDIIYNSQNYEPFQDKARKKMAVPRPRVVPQKSRTPASVIQIGPDENTPMQTLDDPIMRRYNKVTPDKW